MSRTSLLHRELSSFFPRDPIAVRICETADNIILTSDMCPCATARCRGSLICISFGLCPSPREKTGKHQKNKKKKKNEHRRIEPFSNRETRTTKRTSNDAHSSP